MPDLHRQEILAFAAFTAELARASDAAGFATDGDGPASIAWDAMNFCLLAHASFGVDDDTAKDANDEALNALAKAHGFELIDTLDRLYPLWDEYADPIVIPRPPAGLEA